MAPTKRFLITQTTGKGSQQFDLKAKAAMSIAILGCAAALALGGLRAATPAQSQPAAASQAPDSVATTQPMQLPNNSYDDLIWELENSFPAAAAPQQSGQLSGGSYEDLIWEIETAVATSGASPQHRQLSGGSYVDLIWELEHRAP
jgi:hypothetical protein